MNTGDIKCVRCGASMDQASRRGAYLKRVNKVGEPFKGQCAPSCEHKHGNQDDALLGAILDK